MPKFSTIGQLKEAIKDLPDDQFIFSQTTAKDGSCWHMSAEIVQTSNGLVILSLTHKDLTTLLGRSNVT